MSIATVLAGLLLAASPQPASGTAGGLKWSVPAKWTAGEAKEMRVATYQVPAAKGDAESGEVAVFYFGQGQGGGVNANVVRWVDQFRRADGSPAAKDAKIKTQMINLLPVTTVDLKGTYVGGGPMGSGAPKPGYRLLGAIIEGPQGPVFFKFTGPEKTVGSAEKSFRALLGSVKAG
jgi:hypothetical protein